MSIIYINPYRFAAAGPTDPDFANVSLLLHGDGTNGSTTIVDSSSSSKTVTAVGDAQISTAQSKFGGSSIYFDGSGDYLTIPPSANMSLGTADFTIELWARFNTAVTNGLFQLNSGYLNSQVRGPAVGIADTGYWGIYHGTSFLQSSQTPALNAWQHVAYVRSSGSTKLYVDGVQILSTVDTTNYADQYFTIGGWYSTLYLLNGYIDDLRITKGVARYTANFTPPTAPFPDA
jgi:hypothetical protein